MIGQCQLCHNERELQERCHIYPSFVIKKFGSRFHFTKPSGSFGTKQDFYAKYIFCSKCENEIFNKYGEKPVADGYRFPSPLENVSDDALEHFGVSVIYKSSIYMRDSLDNHDNDGLECWRHRALHHKKVSPCHPIICIPTHDDRSHPIATVLNRTFKISIVSENGFKLTWVNMPGFIMAGFLGHPRGAQVHSFRNAFNRVAISQAQQLYAEAQNLKSKRA